MWWWSRKRSRIPPATLEEIQQREAEAEQAGAELREALGALKRRLDAMTVERGLESIARDLAGEKDGG